MVRKSAEFETMDPKKLAEKLAFRSTKDKYVIGCRRHGAVRHGRQRVRGGSYRAIPKLLEEPEQLLVVVIHLVAVRKGERFRGSVCLSDNAPRGHPRLKRRRPCLEFGGRLLAQAELSLRVVVEPLAVVSGHGHSRVSNRLQTVVATVLQTRAVMRAN